MEHKKNFIIILLTIFCLPALSCQAIMANAEDPTSTPYPTSTSKFLATSIPPASSSQTNPPDQSGSIVIQDDFSNPTSGWDLLDDDSGSTGYDSGAYRITIKTDNYYYWSNLSSRYSDIIIEVDAVLDKGSEQNDIGLICRYVDSDNFYFLTYSSDGFFQIAKYYQSEESLVGMESMGFDEDVIKRGNSTNHIRAECIGNQLTLIVNGVELARESDESFEEGKVGIIAGTYDQPELSVLFDNFLAIKP